MAVNALTHKGEGIENCIATPVEVENPITKKKIKVLGIWDTGATHSAITKEAAEVLGLTPVSMGIVHGVHGHSQVNVYYVKITLNNQNITLQTRVSECAYLNATNKQKAGLLIGMNIINMGDFSISNKDGQTIMSFRVPSLENIDYVKEIGEYNKYLKIHKGWIQKGNDKCPCGSGKKYKNCHGNSKYNS